MNKKDYVPTRESEFYPWVKNLVAVSQSKGAQWNISTVQLENLSSSFANYEVKYLIAINPATRTQVAVQAKNDVKKKFTSELRVFCMSSLLHNPQVTNADRNLLGLPVRDTRPTPVPPPHTMPVGMVDTSVHQRHTIRVSDSEVTTKRGGLPAHVRGFEIWRKVGSNVPPVSDNEFVYLNFSSTTSLTVDYSLTEVGQMVWYRFRWVNARNQPGPWSESIVSAVV